MKKQKQQLLTDKNAIKCGPAHPLGCGLNQNLEKTYVRSDTCDCTAEITARLGMARSTAKSLNSN